MPEHWTEHLTSPSSNPHGLRDWKYAWLHSPCGWSAYDIWMAARWRPLTPDERWAFVLEVHGWPKSINQPTARDESGNLEHDSQLSIFAYGADPETPGHMRTPRVYFHDNPFDHV